MWVTDLSTGAPIEGVVIGDTTTDATAPTGADGLAVLAPPGPSTGRLVRGDGDA